jgi:hypothetical protein
MLLRRFSCDASRRRLFVLDLDTLKVSDQSTKRLPVIKDYYSWISYTSAGQERDAWFETWLGQKPENEAVTLLDRAQSLKELDGTEIYRLVSFMLIQLIRTPLGQALLRHDLLTRFQRLHAPILAGNSQLAVSEMIQLYRELHHRDPTGEELLEWIQILTAEAMALKSPSEPSRNALITEMIRTLFPFGAEPLAMMAEACELYTHHADVRREETGDHPSKHSSVREQIGSTQRVQWQARAQSGEAASGFGAQPSAFRRLVLPRVQGVASSTLARATGLSPGYCALIRDGKRVPHPRHSAALQLAGLQAADRAR